MAASKVLPMLSHQNQGGMRIYIFDPVLVVDDGHWPALEFLDDNSQILAENAEAKKKKAAKNQQQNDNGGCPGVCANVVSKDAEPGEQAVKQEKSAERERERGHGQSQHAGQPQWHVAEANQRV